MVTVLFAVIVLFMIFILTISKKGFKLFFLSASFGLLTLLVCNMLSLLPQTDLVTILASIVLSAPGVIVIVFLHLFSFL